MACVRTRFLPSPRDRLMICKHEDVRRVAFAAPHACDRAAVLPAPWYGRRCSATSWLPAPPWSADFPAAARSEEKTRLKEARMARLIYSAIMSLDGYIADANGNFDRAAPDEEVHAFVNDLERSVGT